MKHGLADQAAIRKVGSKQRLRMTQVARNKTHGI